MCGMCEYLCMHECSHVRDLLYVLSGVYARVCISICMLKVDMSCLHRSLPTWRTTAGSLTKLAPFVQLLSVWRRVTALKTLTNWGECRKRLWKYFTEFPVPSQHIQTLVDCSTASQPSQASGLDSCVVSFFTWLPVQFKCYIPRNLPGAEQSPCFLRLKSEHLTCGTYGSPCWCWRKASSQEANHET